MTSSWILDLVLLVIAGGVVVIVLNLLVVWVRPKPTDRKPRSKASIARIRRVMLGLGAAFLVGGWGMLHYEVQGDIARVTGLSPRVASIVLSIGMAIGAGLIGFAVLRPTNRKDE